jgi:hypothetical protein
MRPVGLSIKSVRKKYTGKGSGELMVIHQCVDCVRISINRIAADDSPEELWDVFLRSIELDRVLMELIRQSGISVLDPSKDVLVRKCLFGRV